MLTVSEVAVRVVHRSSLDPARQERLGSYVIESLIAPAEEAAGTVYRVAIDANHRTSTSFHTRAEEYYFVLRGDGTAELDGTRIALRTGDFLRLPPGVTHAFETGADGLEMLNVHTPGCRPDRDTYFVGTTPAGFGTR
jgi:mannose-6-phosphate isomerase-like protein (cupin superfamily)